MSYSGYDIEDTTIMDKASLDQGYGRCVVLKKYGTKAKYLDRTMDQVGCTEEIRGRECCRSEGRRWLPGEPDV